LGTYRTSPIARGVRSLQEDVRSLECTADTLGRKEDDALVAAAHELELECYRLAKEAQDFADMLRRLPRCTICGHMADMENPHEECVEEQAEERERLAQSPPNTAA
jgi:hypothetical protein